MILQDDLLSYDGMDEVAIRITGIARAKPPLHAERWWHADLTTLRRTYSTMRNTVISPHRTTGYPDDGAERGAERRAAVAKPNFHRTIWRPGKQQLKELSRRGREVLEGDKVSQPTGDLELCKDPNAG